MAPTLDKQTLPWDNYHAVGAAHPYRNRYTGHIHFVFPCTPLEDHPLGYFDGHPDHAGKPPIYEWDDIPPEVWEQVCAFNRSRGRHVDYYQMPRPKRDPDCPYKGYPYRDRYTGKIRIIHLEQPIGRYPLGLFDEPGPRGEPIYRWDDIPADWSPDAPEESDGDAMSPRPVAQLTLFGET